MKLIGSRLEDQMRSELAHISHVPSQNPTLQRLLLSVQHAFPNMWSTIILHHIPEQAEDIFNVLVNDDTVATFELLRYGSELAVPENIKTLPAYRQGLNKLRALKLAVALDILSHTPPQNG